MPKHSAKKTSLRKSPQLEKKKKTTATPKAQLKRSVKSVKAVKTQTTRTKTRTAVSKSAAGKSQQRAATIAKTPKKLPKKPVSAAIKPKSKKTVAVPKKASPVKPKAKQTISKPEKTIKPVNLAKQPVIKEKKEKSIGKLPVTKKAPLIVDNLQTTSDEEYMNTQQREHFRHILLDWKKQLLEEMERTVHHLQDEAGSFADPNDRATQEEEFSLELRARDRELKLIKKIEEALQRIDNNEYGYCEACGIEIGVKRLEARPTATLCIDCKTVEEIREKHNG